ncbi:LysM-like peptidoglycan-binding domain-containing protein [Enterobacteriaceae bacterium LUAb1]
MVGMVRGEGSDKPLSNISAGQIVKIRMDSAGTVTALTLEGSQGAVLFIRQPDLFACDNGHSQADLYMAVVNRLTHRA